MSNNRKNIHLQLFISFLKIGCFMFGGGYAMLPLLERELIDKRKWISKDELLELISLSQITPGTIAINTATSIGYKKSSIWGGILASAGIILPSLVFVMSVYYIFGQSIENEIAKNAFLGIRACLIGMIIHSIYKLFKSGIKEYIGIIIFLFFTISLFMGLNPVIAIIGGGICGYIIWWLYPKLSNKDNDTKIGNQNKYTKINK